MRLGKKEYWKSIIYLISFYKINIDAFTRRKEPNYPVLYRPRFNLFFPFVFWTIFFEYPFGVIRNFWRFFMVGHCVQALDALARYYVDVNFRGSALKMLMYPFDLFWDVLLVFYDWHFFIYWLCFEVLWYYLLYHTTFDEQIDLYPERLDDMFNFFVKYKLYFLYCIWVAETEINKISIGSKIRCLF